MNLIQAVHAFTAVEAIRDALFLKFRIATRTSSELDREILAKQSA